MIHKSVLPESPLNHHVCCVSIQNNTSKAHKAWREREREGREGERHLDSFRIRNVIQAFDFIHSRSEYTNKQVQKNLIRSKVPGELQMQLHSLLPLSFLDFFFFDPGCLASMELRIKRGLEISRTYVIRVENSASGDGVVRQ